MLTSDSKKKIKTIKDLINSNDLVRGRVLLEEQVRKEKMMAEAIEFERRNRKNKS